MKRRDFLVRASLGSLVFPAPLYSLLQACTANQKPANEYILMMQALLKDWCDGMIRVQINDPANTEIDGALGCPACNKIHGRCMDAVYPFLYMADVTGEKKYLETGIKVMEWAENVSNPDGSWTVIPDPTSWRGITVFGAIALAEAIYHHGHLLENERRKKWLDRLAGAGEFIYENFSLTYSNINYGFTAVYALNLLGRVLENTIYVERSRELAKEVRKYFTEPNKLVFGEGKPIDKKSPGGLNFVDLGYNVEESLNGLVMYALHEKDEELLVLLTTSMESHLKFMLPDGAWDNSWGTRQAKWSYWGSRTTDGCQLGFGMMANRNPAFGTAAIKNTELLKRCTSNGLLHGGPHYVSHGVKPCVHHTFAHAKSLAGILDAGNKLPDINASTPLPRSVSDGITEFPEIATWLFGRGPWRGTVTAYDAVYREHVQQATGGSLAVLYHDELGTLSASSMAEYLLVEKNNQQPNPGEDFALTPRVETFSNQKWYTNLYDLSANVRVEDKDQTIRFEVHASLKDEDRNPVAETASAFKMIYTCDKDKIEIRAGNTEGKEITFPTAMVFPIISPRGEKVTQVSPRHIEVEKPEGKVVIESNVNLNIKETEKSRVFNMVPGAEAIPIIAWFPQGKSGDVVLSIHVKD